MPSSYGITQRSAPATLDADGTSKAFRQGRYGDTSTISMGDSHSALCEEGAYYKATTNSAGAITFINPITPSAGAFGTGTTFNASGSTQNQGLLSVLNISSPSSGPRIYFDYIKLICEVAPTIALVYCNWAITTANYDRYQAGANLTASAPFPYNTNSDYANESIAKLTVAGLSVMTLGTQPTANPKTVAQGTFKRNAALAAGLVVGDTLVLDFGDHVGSAQTLVSAVTGPRQFAQATGPLSIGPGQFMAMHMWSNLAGGTATQFQLDMGWWER
jgi:hypothetical protein